MHPASAPCGKDGDECVCAGTSGAPGNLSDLLWTPPLLQLFACRSLRERSFSLSPSQGNTYAPPDVCPPLLYKRLYLRASAASIVHAHNASVQVQQQFLFRLVLTESLPSIFLIPLLLPFVAYVSFTHRRLHKRTQRAAVLKATYIIKGPGSSIRGISTQLYSGVKTALVRTPSGLRRGLWGTASCTAIILRGQGGKRNGALS